jgi:hypothetical protein
MASSTGLKRYGKGRRKIGSKKRKNRAANRKS